MKKRKTIKMIIACFTILGGLSVFGTPSFAAGGQINSKGTINFLENTGKVDPTDPLNPDPENPVQPKDLDEHEEGTAGPLSIDYVSNIRFGEQKTSGKDEVYYAALDKLVDSKGNEVERPNFIQVTDKRGSNAGWHLTVTQNEQFKNGKESLKGAVLKLDNGTMSSADGGESPSASQGIALNPGMASDVANAKENQGTGTWADRFGKDEAAGKKSISLSVPGKTKKVKGEYKTTLTWTLTDSPA